MCVRTVLLFRSYRHVCVSQKDNKCSAVAEMGDRLATLDIGRKVGAAATLSVEGVAGSPSNTMSPVRWATVWPQ